MVCTVALAEAQLDGQGLAALAFLDLELPEPLGLALAASATSFNDGRANQACPLRQVHPIRAAC